jgi:hypothetical protein
MEVTVTGYAYCTPQKFRLTSRLGVDFAPASAVTTPRCPKGTVAVAGGAYGRPSGYFYESRKVGNRWRVSGGLLAPFLDTTLRTRVYCHGPRAGLPPGPPPGRR